MVFEIHVELSTYTFVKKTFNDKSFFLFSHEIPDNFGSYSITKVKEELNSSERLKRYMIYQKNVRFLPRTIETSRTFKLETEYLHAFDIIVSGLGIFGRNRTLISVRGVDTPDLSVPVKIINHVESAIALAHYHMTFSMPFYNIFFPISVIPQDAIKRSVLIIPKSHMKFCEEIYKICYGYNQVISLDHNEYIHCNEFHTVIHPTPGISHYATTAYNFSLLYRKKFNLTSIIPNQYALCNRVSKYARHIRNFDEIVDAVKGNLSNYQWNVLEDEYKTMIESAKVWATIKVILAPTGSNLVRCIAMAPNTAMCCIFGDRYDWEVVAITQVFEIFIYVLPVPDMAHFSAETKNIIDPSLVVHVLNDTVYAAENKKWKESTIIENEGMSRSYKPFPA